MSNKNKANKVKGNKDKAAVIIPTAPGTGTAIMVNPTPNKDSVLDKALAAMDKAAPVDKGDTKAGIPTQDLVKWVCQAYDTSILDRSNGKVYHVSVGGGSHKKLIKLPTFENKQGVFFGSMVNGVMSDLAKQDITKHHVKSNVYKIVKSTLDPNQFLLVLGAIVKVCGDPKVPIAIPVTDAK